LYKTNFKIVSNFNLFLTQNYALAYFRRVRYNTSLFGNI